MLLWSSLLTLMRPQAFPLKAQWGIVYLACLRLILAMTSRRTQPSYGVGEAMTGDVPLLRASAREM